MTVTITGLHFDLGVTSVLFGKTTTTNFTVVSPSKLAVVTPAVPGGQPATVDVQLNTPLGTSPLSPSDLYTYTSG